MLDNMLSRQEHLHRWRNHTEVPTRYLDAVCAVVSAIAHDLGAVDGFEGYSPVCDVGDE